MRFALRATLHLVIVLLALAAPTASAQVDLVFVIDGSGSIDAADFALQKDGISNALDNPLLFPRDGSIAVALVQFGNNTTSLGAPYTILVDEASVQGVISQIAAAAQISGGTNPGDGVNAAMALLNASGRPAALQSICMSMDGIPGSATTDPRTGASSPRPLYLTECLLIGPKENAA